MANSDLDPDVIAAQIIGRLTDLTAFLSSHDVEDQRKVLFALCKRIVANAEQREIVVETDLTGGAHSASDGQLPRLCNLNLPDLEAEQFVQPFMSTLYPILRYKTA